MTKRTFSKTFTFALFYSLIWLMSSWLFTSTIDLKQYLASCLIASVVYYLLESRTQETEIIEQVASVKAEATTTETEAKPTRQYTRKEPANKPRNKNKQKKEKEAKAKPEKQASPVVKTNTTQAVLDATTAATSEELGDVVFNPTATTVK